METQEQATQEKKGWSWLEFLLAPYQNNGNANLKIGIALILVYTIRAIYTGNYQRLVMGLGVAILISLLISLYIMLYGSGKDLPIKKQKIKEIKMETQKQETGTEEMETQEKKGWSWLGFLFTPYYYMGYNDLKKGIIFAVIAGIAGGFGSLAQPPQILGTGLAILILLLIGLPFAIYGGLNARKDLPIKKQKFSWGKAFLALIIMQVISVIFLLAAAAIVVTGTPRCSDDDAKQLVIEIATEEIGKIAQSNKLADMKLLVKNIRTSAYDENIDKYECVAELHAIRKSRPEKSASSEITYTVQNTEDGEDTYVEVFGL